jgi:cell fate regulator YaaT (PSP1 superfamily)
MAPAQEYLVSYGISGTLGRFRAEDGRTYHRNDRVLVQSERGQEVGTVVLGSNGHSLALPFFPVPGQLLRSLTPADELHLQEAALQCQRAFTLARTLAETQELPVEIVDVEAVVEPFTLILHYLQFGPCDFRPLVSQLARQFQATVLLQDLTAPQPAGGCGSCGEGCDSGNCGSGGCGTGGGCGSCSAGSQEAFTQEWQAFFAERRADMERRRISLPL